MDRGSRSRIPYFTVLQADLLSDLATVIVAPVRPKRAQEVISRLNPSIEMDGKPFFVTMQDMAEFPAPDWAQWSSMFPPSAKNS